MYPAVVHWVWSGSTAWLSNGEHSGIVFYDFAGSGVVHLVGGACAFVFAGLVGAREGRFLEDGTPQTIQPHNMVLSCCGVLLLVLGWFGFNGGSVGAASDGNAAMAGRVCVVSAIGAAAGGLSSFSVTYYTDGFICLHAIANGILAGLVSVTAGANVFHPETALITGALGGLFYRASSHGILKLGIDDPLEASPIHGFCGIWGLIAVGLFANDNGVHGLFYGDAAQLGHQILGAFVITAWSAGFMGIVLSAMHYVSDGRLLRVPLDIELAGDFILYNGSAYPQFDDEGNVAPPSGHMAVVITDVQDSTALWEWNAEVMQDSLGIQETVLRDNLTRFSGYETMDEGDSLSIVFHNALDGLNFCLTTQQDLMLQNWQEELYNSKSAAKEGKLWCGLRVRMAIHCGNGVKFMNHSTNRLAYEGPVVEETAAILKAVDGGGIIVCSTSILGDLAGKYSHKTHELPDYAFQDIGDYLLPKVQDPVSLVQIMPKELCARPATSMSGCMKLSTMFAEAPGVATPGGGVAFVFCNLKFNGAEGQATEIEAEKKPRRSSAGRAPKNNAKNEEFLSDLLRTTTFSHKGYVTKTSNGVSLLAFNSSSEALRFIKDIAAAVVAKGNLTFSAGLHFGTPTNVHPNKASGRAEYLGPPVNVAARIMALTTNEAFKASGGCTCAVSQDAYTNLDDGDKGAMNSAGKFPLKGVAEAMEVYSCAC